MVGGKVLGQRHRLSRLFVHGRNTLATQSPKIQLRFNPLVNTSRQ